MNFRDGVIITLMVIGGIAFLIGLLSFVAWDNENDKAESAKNCENIAKLANVKEWKSDGYDCYIIKDGKIVEVEL